MSELGTGASAHRLSGASRAYVVGTRTACCGGEHRDAFVLQATFALRAMSELGTGASAHRLSGASRAYVVGAQHARCVLSRRTLRCVLLQATFALRAMSGLEPGLAPTGSAVQAGHTWLGRALRVVAENIAMRCASGHVCPAGNVRGWNRG